MKEIQEYEVLFENIVWQSSDSSNNIDNLITSYYS